MLRRLFNSFLDDMHDASDVAQLGRAYGGLAANLGFEHIVVLDPAQFDSKPPIFTTQARTGAGGRNGYAGHPIVTEALAFDRPILGEDVRARSGIGESAWAATLPVELRTGAVLVLPVHHDGHCVLIIVCNGRETTTASVARAVLHAAAHVFYERLLAARAHAPDREAFSNREAECLYWMGQGKTGVEIARLTGISPRTVRYHLQSVKRKLGVNSPLEALVKLSGGARKPD